MSQSFDSSFILDLLRSPDAIEAAEWLSHGGSSHYVGEMSHEESVDLVAGLYHLGAMRVIAVEIAENAGLASTDTLIATLPSAKHVRDAIFSWNNDRVQLMGADPDEDRGQNYLLVYFD